MIQLWSLVSCKTFICRWRCLDEKNLEDCKIVSTLKTLKAVKYNFQLPNAVCKTSGSPMSEYMPVQRRLPSYPQSPEMSRYILYRVIFFSAPDYIKLVFHVLHYLFWDHLQTSTPPKALPSPFSHKRQHMLLSRKHSHVRYSGTKHQK